MNTILNAILAIFFVVVTIRAFIWRVKSKNRVFVKPVATLVLLFNLFGAAWFTYLVFNPLGM